MSKRKGVGAKAALTELTLEWAALRQRIDGYIAAGLLDHLPDLRDRSIPAVWEGIHADLSELVPVVAVEPAFVGRLTWKRFWARLADLRTSLDEMKRTIEREQRRGTF